MCVCVCVRVCESLCACVCVRVCVIVLRGGKQGALRFSQYKHNTEHCYYLHCYTVPVSMYDSVPLSDLFSMVLHSCMVLSYL